ncbi:MAG: hypothetical protein GY913_12485 [Proteobacteria bacterium]|nr:hypothetical protein [Pseudomonadota bacterium]MCP4917734.1 hypothetical protein [Pseudomonadota bacterium]
MDGVHEFPIRLPRHAFTPRQVARPAEVWRAFQEAAVLASTECGWPPERYLAEQVAFVVTSMTAIHEREVRYGEELLLRTWLRDFRRDILTKREVRLVGPDGLVAATTQQWAHVGNVDGRMAPTRATPALMDAFTRRDDLGPVIGLPKIDEPVDGAEHTFTFSAWNTWMDPLGHANHPSYLDWCDEALARMAAAQGLDPQTVVPVAERIHWKAGVTAGDIVEVTSQVVGSIDGAWVLRHRMRGADGALYARATTVRRLDGLRP